MYYRRISIQFDSVPAATSQSSNFSVDGDVSSIEYIEVRGSVNNSVVAITRDSGKLVSVDFPRDYIAQLSYPVRERLFSLDVRNNHTAAQTITVVITYKIR